MSVITRISIETGQYLQDIAFQKNLKIISPRTGNDEFKLQFSIIIGDGTDNRGDTLFFEVPGNITVEQVREIVAQATGEEELQRLEAIALKKREGTKDNIEDAEEVEG